MQKLLTIVVPVYKVEPYINKCLDSLILDDEKLMNQLEVIIVNDGTPDRSAEMSREYVKRFPNTFRQIDKENGGHGSAWNRGLKEATGKYLRFLDSDDWLTNFEPFMNKISMVNVDIVFTPINKFYEKTNMIQTYGYDDFQEMYCYNIETFEWKPSHQYGIMDFWYATYRTSMLQKHYPLFVEKVYYDDAILFVAPLILAKNFVYCNEVLYNYRLEREGQSVDKVVQRKHALDYVPVSKSMIDFIRRHPDISPLQKKRVEEVMSSYIIICFNFFKVLRYKVFKNNVETWYNYVRENCPYFNRKTLSMKLYERMPFFIFWIYLKVVPLFSPIRNLLYRFR